MSKLGTLKRLDAAIQKDTSILIDRKDLKEEVEGFTLKHLENIGLRKEDVRRLKDMGIVHRKQVVVINGNQQHTENRYILVGDAEVANAETTS